MSTLRPVVEAPNWITDDWKLMGQRVYLEVDERTGEIIRAMQTGDGIQHTVCPTCSWHHGMHHPRCETKESDACPLPCVLSPEWKLQHQ